MLACVLAVGATHVSAEAAQGPLVKTVRIEGASIYTSEEIAARRSIVAGSRLTTPVEELAAAIREQYHKDGYTLAAVDASLDEGTGILTIRIDEGRFDAVDVTGVPEQARQRVLDSLALHPGDIFNRSQANRALDEALAFAQGAIERAEPPFALVSDTSRRVLQVALRTRTHRSGGFVGTQGREDWYSPVDALNVGAGVHSTLFDRARFNHTYWAGFISYKFGPDRAGYSIGFERPFFADGVLQAGASLHDLTASDDGWRLGGDEQSLVALTFRNTFRDYYRRKGYQLHAAVRPLNNQEFLVAWRDDRHLSLANETQYGFFRDTHQFRANAPSAEGDLRAVLLVYTYDSRGLGRQRPSERYQRHLLDDLFGERTATEHGVRFDWRSELANLPGDLKDSGYRTAFDFNRHIGQARGWWALSPRRLISARVVAGGTTGTPPPQRVFALGGIGTVHGYSFKERAGEGLLLLNGEISQKFFGGLAGLAFIDAGRVYKPRSGSSGDWMRGVGVGVRLGDEGPRIELGWRLDDVPQSLQVLFRLRPTF